MNFPKTIIVFDKNTHQTQSIINALDGHFQVLSLAFQSIPDVHHPYVAAIFILCIKPDEAVYEKIEELKFIFPHQPIALFSPTPQPEEVTFAIRKGAKGYFNLPVSETKLMGWLREVSEPSNPMGKWMKRIFSRFFTPKTHFPVVVENIIPLPDVKKVEAVFHSAVEILTDGSMSFESSETYENAISVQFFGNFQVSINQKNIAIRNGGLLLAYLLFQYPRPVHKKKLMEKFWPDSIDDSAKNCLNATIFSLRRLMNETAPNYPIIVFKNEHYAIHNDWQVHSDVLDFKNYWEKARTIERTQGLSAALSEYQKLSDFYKDDFLSSYSKHEWVLGERDTFRERYLQVLHHLADYFWEMRQYVATIEQCQTILAIEDCLESIHRRLIACYIELKMKDKALLQFKRCEQSLKKINAHPSKETVDLYGKINSL